MVSAHVSMIKIRQLIKMTKPCIGVHRNLACLHRAVGKNNVLYCVFCKGY